MCPIWPIWVIWVVYMIGFIITCASLCIISLPLVKQFDYSPDWFTVDSFDQNINQFDRLFVGLYSMVGALYLQIIGDSKLIQFDKMSYKNRTLWSIFIIVWWLLRANINSVLIVYDSDNYTIKDFLLHLENLGIIQYIILVLWRKIVKYTFQWL